jgi:hypothetical protein
MGTERAVTVSARKRFTRELVAGNFEKHCKNEPRQQVRRKRRAKRRMRVWEGHTVLNLLRAGEDAGWVVAMIVIGLPTFAASSIFVKGGSFANCVWAFVQHS